MSFTSSSNWIVKIHPTNSNNSTHDILVIIGFLTVCLFLFILILQFVVKVRQIYRTSEPEIRYKQSRYPSYQKLLNLPHNRCSSCLPKFQCVRSNYEKIDEKYSIYRISTPRPHSTRIGIHNSFV